MWKRRRSGRSPRDGSRIALLPLIVLLSAAGAGAQEIELLSQTDRGFSAEGRSNAPALNQNGSVAAFGSDALDLVPPARSVHRSDVFLRSRTEPASTRRIVSGTDGEVDGPSQVGGFAPAISADGRTVAFSSAASNLVANDTNDVTDIFVYDDDTGLITRVEGAGGEPDGTSSFPRLSADGRFLVFTSQATNLLAAEDDNFATDLFLYDRDSGVMRRISDGFDGSPSNGDSRSPAISAGGRTVAFVSAATNLVDADAGSVEQIYVHGVDSGVTELVSVSSEGEPSNGNCFLPDLSGDGSVVAFKSEGSNLVAPGRGLPDTNGVPDVFVHTRADGETRRVSVDDFGNQANSLSGGPAISDDGRYVAFISFSSTFDPDDGNGFSDVFVVDRAAAEIRRVTVALPDTGRPGGDVPDFPATISGDGRWIGFASAAENLVEGDVNNQVDSFVACNPFEPDCSIAPTPTATATPTATPGPAACTGDCDGDGTVGINELVRMTNIALGASICGEGSVEPCPAGDANGDCAITVEELVRAVGNNLDGCTRFGDLPLQEVIAMCCPL